VKKVALLAALVVFALVANPAAAKKGDIIVGDSGSSEVLRVDPKTGANDVISDDPQLNSPNEAAFTPDGKLFVADYDLGADSRGGIVMIDPRTGATSELVQGDPFEQPDGLARAPSGDLFATDLDATADDGALFQVSLPGGDVLHTFSGGELVDSVGIVVPPNGKPIVSGFGPPAITEISPATGEQRTIADSGDGLTGSGGRARAADGTLFINSSDTLEAVNPRTGDVELVATGFETNSYGLAIDFKGRVLGGASESIIRANPRTGAVNVVAEGLDFPEGLEIEPPKCQGKFATIVGSTKKDKLKGSKFKDVIHTLGGKDKVNAKGGNDIVCGGGGKDKLKGGKGKDKLLGQGGKDKLDGGPGKDKEQQ
jgi:hypothetical protein